MAALCHTSEAAVDEKEVARRATEKRQTARSKEKDKKKKRMAARAAAAQNPPQDHCPSAAARRDQRRLVLAAVAADRARRAKKPVRRLSPTALGADCAEQLVSRPDMCKILNGQPSTSSTSATYQGSTSISEDMGTVAEVGTGSTEISTYGGRTNGLPEDAGTTSEPTDVPVQVQV